MKRQIYKFVYPAVPLGFATLQFFFFFFPKGMGYLVYIYISIPLGSVLEINQDLPP